MVKQVLTDFKYFSHISLNEYNEYANKFLSATRFSLSTAKKNWYLKYETIKYCLLDCKVLYQILIKFANTRCPLSAEAGSG